MNLSVLIHSFSQYSFLWEGQVEAITRNWPDAPKIYFSSDIACEWGIHLYNYRGDREIIYSGVGEWSDRLRRLLAQIPSEYLLYMQEDHWPRRQPPDLSRMMEIVQEYDLLRLQVAPMTHFYSVKREGEILMFASHSKYLVSHQPSIWKKDFLLSCLEPGESPWVNEYEGTKRLNNHPDIENRIAIFP